MGSSTAITDMPTAPATLTVTVDLVLQVLEFLEAMAEYMDAVLLEGSIRLGPRLLLLRCFV
jgi:hypothetical protein